MSKIDDLVASIGSVTSKIDEATGAAAASIQETDDIRAQAEALGADALVEVLDQVKEQHEALSATLEGASQRAGEIQILAKSVAEGT